MGVYTRCGYKGDLTPGSILRWSRTAAEIGELAFVVSGGEDIAGAYVASPQSNGDIWYSLASDPDRTVRPTVDPSGNGYDFCHPTVCTCVDVYTRCGYKGDLTPGSILRWSRTAAEIGECYDDVARSVAAQSSASLGSDGAKARSVASW